MRFILCGITIVFISSNLYAGPPSWKELKKENADNTYCVQTYAKEKDIKLCNIELIAFQRAGSECENDSNPSYCFLMAKSGWKNFKGIVGKKKITEDHAKNYPVMCGWEDKPVRPCSKSQ